MTATQTTPVYVPPSGNVAFTGVLASEWTKLRSLRSTVWSLVAAVGMLVGFGLLFSWGVVSRWDRLGARERLTFDPTRISLGGVFLAQLAIGVLGVLIIGGEFSTGMIRSSLAAVPKRLPVLWAKAAVFAVVTFVLMLPSVLIGFFASQAILARHHILQISFGDPGIGRAVVGGAVYLVLVGVLALSIGAILRNTAGSISAFAALFFVIPPLLNILPSSWNDAISPYLPSNAGQAFLVTSNPGGLSPWPGLALFIGYTALGLAIAAVLLVRRDT